MLKSHVKFHSVEGKRLILIADDEPANRALLGLVTEDEYDILYAEDGEETLRLMRENASFLSLVLLDLNMPKKTGFDVMEEARKDEKISDIPIIVLTSEETAEVKRKRNSSSLISPSLRSMEVSRLEMTRPFSFRLRSVSF